MTLNTVMNIISKIDKLIEAYAHAQNLERYIITQSAYVTSKTDKVPKPSSAFPDMIELELLDYKEIDMGTLPLKKWPDGEGSLPNLNCSSVEEFIGKTHALYFEVVDIRAKLLHANDTITPKDLKRLNEIYKEVTSLTYIQTLIKPGKTVRMPISQSLYTTTTSAPPVITIDSLTAFISSLE